MSLRCLATSSTLHPSGPGAPSLDFSCTSASLSVPSFATSSILIAGGATPLFLLLGFVTALLLELVWPASVTSATPFGLSAVPKFICSCRVCSLAVTTFPPCPLAVMTAFRRLSGTTWSSDFSRPFVISFLFLDDYRRALLCSPRPRDLPRQERRTSVSLPSPLRAINQRISGFNAVGQLTLIARLTALRFRSVQHGTLDFHRTPLFRGFLSPRSMPLSLRCRVPSVWAPRGLTFFQVHLLFCAHAGRT